MYFERLLTSRACKSMSSVVPALMRLWWLYALENSSVLGARRKNVPTYIEARYPELTLGLRGRGCGLPHQNAQEYSGVAQSGQRVRLITERTQVRILSPPPRYHCTAHETHRVADTGPEMA